MAEILSDYPIQRFQLGLLPEKLRNLLVDSFVETLGIKRTLQLDYLFEVMGGWPIAFKLAKTTITQMYPGSKELTTNELEILFSNVLIKLSTRYANQSIWTGLLSAQGVKELLLLAAVGENV